MKRWIGALLLALGLGASASAQTPVVTSGAYLEKAAATLTNVNDATTLTDTRGFTTLQIYSTESGDQVLTAYCRNIAATWVALPTLTNIATGGTSATITGTGAYRVDINGCTAAKVEVTTDTSGTSSVYLLATQAPIGGGGAGGGGDASEATLSSVDTSLNNIETDIDELAAATNSNRVDVNISTIGGSTPPPVDPCSAETQTSYVVNLATAATTEIANAVASEFFYICSVNLVVAGAQGVALAEDDTDGCGSVTAGLNGGTTGATGWSFAANGGIVIPNTGRWALKTATANRYLCIVLSQSVQTSGTITYVSAP